VLDFVPLAGSQWQVADRHLQAGVGGEGREFDFLGPYAGAVGAAAVGTDQQPVRVRIAASAYGVPPPAQGSDRERGGAASSATRVKREISTQITNALGGAAPLFTSTICHSVAATDARGAGLLIHAQAARLEGELFWKALKEGRKPTSPGAAPALTSDYANLSHEILVRISDPEQQPTPEADQADQADQADTAVMA
jgi:hypothetical protein